MAGGRFPVVLGVVAVVIVLAAGAYLVRSVVVLASRTRWPRVAAAADRWWRWAPLGVICAAGIWLFPLVGIPLTIGLAVALTRPGAIGSPLRPR